jgi:hypothetical protein
MNKGWKDFDVKLTGAKSKAEVAGEVNEAEG